MRCFALIVLFLPSIVVGQVKSKELTCDCLVWNSVEARCNTPSKVSFSIKFNGQAALMRMRGYDYRLSFEDAFVDPSGVRNSMYLKRGEVTAITTFPVADNYVSVFTHPGEQEITSAFCRE